MASVKHEIKQIRISYRCSACSTVIKRKDTEPKPRACPICRGEIIEVISPRKES